MIRNLLIKAMILCSLVITSAITCAAQGVQRNKAARVKPDLTGTWQLDYDKSNIGKPAKGSSTAEVKIKIVHSEPELKMHRMFYRDNQPATLDLTYFTDGRGETNQTTMYVTDNPGSARQQSGADVTKSKTRWSGDKLVTRSLVRNILSGRVVEYEVVDEWKLSADGKTLTQTTQWIYQPDSLRKSIYIPSRAPDAKRVYNRIS